MITLLVLTLLTWFLIGGWHFNILDIALSLTLSFVVTEVLCGILYTTKEYKPYETETTNIYSLQGSSGVSGSFVFGSGTVESEPVYYFAFKVSDKTYKIDKISGDILFVLDNPQQPYIETQHMKLERTNTDSIGYKYFVTDYLANTKTLTKIHLPETAIQQNYSAMPN